MKEKSLMQDDYCYISPLEARHYILDIPVTKSKYQYNAVKFALRSLYPGNEDSTVIDYIAIKKTLIGVAANSERIKKQKEDNKIILSPTLIINQLEKNGIFVYAGENWLELQVIKDGIPDCLRAYSSNQFQLCIQDYIKLADKYNFSEQQKILYLFNSVDELMLSEFKANNFELKNIKSFMGAVNLKKAEVFIERIHKTKWIPVFVSLFLLLIFLTIDFIFYEKSKKLKAELDVVKNEYQVKMQQMKESPVAIEIENTDVNEVFSVYDIFKELYKAADDLKIISFSLDGNVIRFEAENASALEVFEKLSKSMIFENVILHQSLPQKDGFERFVISGRVVE